MPFENANLRRIASLVWRIAVLAALVAMGKTAWQYSTFQNDIAFLELKQEYIQNQVWKAAFYIHVFSSSLTLLAGLSQFSSRLLKRHRGLHKVLGYLYVVTVLAVNVPSAFVMAVYANGGMPSKAAFLILDSLWFWFTWTAVRKAQRKDIVGHKAAMIRSYALTCSALTLRLWVIVLVGPLGITPELSYKIVAWLGFIPNLLIAEILIRNCGMPRLNPCHISPSTKHRDTSPVETAMNKPSALT